MEDNRLEGKAISLADDISSIILDLINEIEAKEREIVQLNQQIEDLNEKYTILDNKVWDLEHP
jgi:hypothetical protein